MTSFGYRLNPRYAIKEFLSCGALYTENFCCSKGSVEDKVLVLKPPKNYARCAKCGHPVNGHYCQGCVLLQEKLEEDLVSYLKYFHDTSESSDDSTNVVNAHREPFVVKQDHGVKSSQNPPPIDECCCECGKALDGIFCQQCICKSYGKGAHIGYNCPPKFPIISNPESCNQIINNELPQTLPSFDSVPCVSKPNFVDESSNIFNPPPQHPIYSCEFYGSNAQYGHYCTPQAPFNNPEPGYSQDFNFLQYIHNFQQQYFCCDQCGGPHETFQSHPGAHPFPYTVAPPSGPAVACNLQRRPSVSLPHIPAVVKHQPAEIDVHCSPEVPRTGHAFFPILDSTQHSSLRQPSSYLPLSPAVLPVASIPSRPLLRLSRATRGSAATAASDWPTSGAAVAGTSSGSGTSGAVVPWGRRKLANSKNLETNTFHNSLPEFENFCFDLEEISSGSTTTHSVISLPEYEALSFYDDHIEEISSGSTTTQSDISLPEYDSFIFDLSNDQFLSTDRSDLTHEEFGDEPPYIISPPKYDCFYFGNLPGLGELISSLNSRIRENLSSTTRVNLPVEDDYSPLLAYVVKLSDRKQVLRGRRPVRVIISITYMIIENPRKKIEDEEEF
nr:hypothetical protein [Tanacetum cinerariifolium]